MGYVQEDIARDYAEEINAENFDVNEYFEEHEVYDYDTIKSRDGDTLGVRVYIAYGGPGICINTEDAEVICSWGLTASAPIRYDRADDIRNYFTEVWGV